MTSTSSAFTPPQLAKPGSVAEDWAEALAPVSETLVALEKFLTAEQLSGRGFLPPGNRVMAAFKHPLESVRVLIVGQDPYPTPGHSIGQAFSVERTVRPIPRSLRNIYRELHDDLAIEPAPHGDLSAWTTQGVMLLNRVLTVQPGVSASHAGRGWEQVTEHAIRTLAERGGPLVAILWGNQAKKLAPVLSDIPVIASAHPSPLSAARGFFGSRPFSKTNALLRAQGADALDWTVK